MNLRPPRVVVVDANAFWTRSLFASLGVQFDVLLVEPRDFRHHAALHSGRRMATVTETLASGVVRLAFPVPPRFTTLLWPLARRLLARQIRAHGGDRPDVLAVSFPEYADLWDDLRPIRRLYYNYDDYGTHWPHRADCIQRLEDRAVSMADFTICVSQHRTQFLKRRFPAKSGSIIHIPNGVTPCYMADATAGASEPLTIGAIPRPRAGYIGALSYRFDFPFLAQVATARPNISFVLGGREPTRADGDEHWWQGVKQVRELPNVHFVGWVNHDDLGNYLAAMDLLLMPYSRCAFNDSACPTKLWDYLGTGLPVVANANNPETLLWRDLVDIGDTPESFSLRIDKALSEIHSNHTDRRDARLAVARAHTWDRLAERLAQAIGVNELPGISSPR